MAGSGSVGCQDSNSVRAMPLCRMIESSVPMASSGWSGTGTVTVPALLGLVKAVFLKNLAGISTGKNAQFTHAPLRSV